RRYACRSTEKRRSRGSLFGRKREGEIMNAIVAPETSSLAEKSVPQAPLLEVRDLHVSYGKTQALHGVDLTVQQGEVIALLGANGAGKSTTLRTISGLLKPTSGKITFRGNDISGVSADRI